jgi:hypothetical protein
MKNAKLYFVIVLFVLGVDALLYTTPLSNTAIFHKFNSSIRLLGLVLGVLSALTVVKRLETSDPQKKTWKILTMGMFCQSCAQSILFSYQVFGSGKAPFPSSADVFFPMAVLFCTYALFSFCFLASHSGFALGTRWSFWWPGWILGGLSFLTCGALLLPVLNSQSETAAKALNLFYPLSNSLIIIPCAVMLRVAIKFKGGNLLLVWLPITTGFLIALVSDVLFAYFSSLNIKGFGAAVNLLYTISYQLVPCGFFFQAALLGRDEATAG